MLAGEGEQLDVAAKLFVKVKLLTALHIKNRRKDSH